MSGSFLYFAYGSNMFTKRLRKRTPSAKIEGIGFVEGRRLTFDKVSTDKSGKCDMQATETTTDRVYGVLFSILESERPELDKAEGRGKGYEVDTVFVNCGGAVRPADTYIASKKDASLVPYDWYKALVIAGAVEHQLPAGYIEWIRTVASQSDPDPKNRQEAESLLFESA